MKKLCSNIFSNLFFVYKNIFHFTFSKILIVVISIFYILILVLPVLLIFALIAYFLWIFDVWFNIYVFLWNIYYMIFLVLAIIFLFFAYIIWYSYSQVLLTRLNFSYIKKEKLGFFKNYYFDFKLFKKYFFLTLHLIWIFFLPVLFFLISLFFLIEFLWWIDIVFNQVKSNYANYFSIISLIVLILSFLSFVYLSYKTLFSYIILVDRYLKWKDFKKSFYYIKKSFKFTKWFKKFFSLVFVFLVFIWIFSPIYIWETYLQDKIKEQRLYLKYNLLEKSWQDLWVEKAKYEALKLDFWNEKIEEIANDLRKEALFYWILKILEFIFIFWTYNLVLVSFYKYYKKNED